MKPILVVFVVCLLSISISYASTCYQETSNVSSGCGDLDTGNYSCSGIWASPAGSCENVFDGNDSTSGWGLALNTGYLQITYAKPDNSTINSTWRVFDITETNLSFPQDCWDYSADYLFNRGYASDASVTDGWQCWNGSWVTLRSGSGGGKLSEEGMTWDLSGGATNSCTYTSGDWEVTDNCNMTGNVNVLNNEFKLSNNSTFTTSFNITNMSKATVYGSKLYVIGSTFQVN